MKKTLKIVFMGSQDFSVHFLKLLVDSAYNITSVFTREPKEAGRGRVLQKTPVHTYAQENNLDVTTPKTLKSYFFEQDSIPDIIIVVAYGLILPKHIIETPKYGTINVHPSALPRWRGAAPIERTIMAADKSTESIIMKMDEGLDTGDIIVKEIINIDPKDNFQTLSDKIVQIASSQLLYVLENLDSAIKLAYKQSENAIIYAHKLTKDDKNYDFTVNDCKISASQMDANIRALFPKYGLNIKLFNINEEFKILQADFENKFIDPSLIGHGVNDSKVFKIGLIDGYIIPKLIKKINGKIVNNREFLNYQEL